MGYTHYFYSKPELPSWPEFRQDAQKILDTARAMGLKLAGPQGTGAPILSDDVLSLNGAEHCGHAPNTDISIPWPAPTATGIGDNATAIAGGWFAGSLLQHRACNGDCSYETFHLSRTWPQNDSRGPHWIGTDDKQYRFACCKTAYRPYDVVVTALLIAAKRHFGDAIRVNTDGEEKDWNDGRILYTVATGDDGQRFAGPTLFSKD